MENNEEQFTEEAVLDFIKSKNNKCSVITTTVDKETAKLLSSEVKEKDTSDNIYNVETSGKSIFNTDDSISIYDVNITDEEKENWLKAILLDMEVNLEIKLCEGKLIYNIKSLSTEEDRFLAKIITNPNAYGFYNYNTYDLARKLIIASNLIEENNSQFFKQSFLCKFRSRIKNLKNKIKYLDSLSSNKYKAIINAFKIFDRKIFLLNNSLLDSSFWKPLS